MSSRTTPPQIRHYPTTGAIMWTIVTLLLPAVAWGVLRFGLRSLLVVGVSVITALLAEAVAAAALKRRGVGDGHAVLVGLLISVSMPAHIPLFVPISATLFAVLVVKWSFGGLGSYWMNPVLAGWTFAYLSWPQAWQRLDAVGAATPLAAAREATGAGPIAAAEAAGAVGSSLDASITEWLNLRLLTPLGIDLPNGYVDLFLGHTGGSIGEVSAGLLLIASVILLGSRIVRWHIPAAMFVTFSLLIWMFAGLPYGTGYFSGDVLFHVLSGGFLLTLFFLAPESGSSPYTRGGMLVFGALVGALAALFRLRASVPEGVAFAVILANVAGPLIHSFTQRRRFGQMRRGGIAGDSR